MSSTAPSYERRPNSSHDNMSVVCGNSNPELAAKVCQSLRMQPARVHVDTFADGEVHVEFIDNMRGQDIYILQSLSNPANQNLMELALLADAARRSSASSVSAVVPYLSYSRQDRRPRGDRTPISARVVANILETSGIDNLVTIDLHSEQIQGFYSIPVINMYASNVLLGEMSRLIASKGFDSSPVITSPDIGGVARARAMAKMLDLDIAIIDKRRPRANVAEVMNVIGDVEGRHCFLVDDMIDTAGTLCAAAVALQKQGAASVRAFATHLLLSGAALNRIEDSVLEEIIGTDTVPLTEQARNNPKIRTQSVAELLAEALLRIDGKQSVGALFMD